MMTVVAMSLQAQHPATVEQNGFIEFMLKRHEGREKNSNRDLLREFFHGEGNAHAAKAVTNQNNLLIAGQRCHEIQQRLGVLFKGTNLFYWRHVYARSFHV